VIANFPVPTASDLGFNASLPLWLPVEGGGNSPNENESFSNVSTSMKPYCVHTTSPTNTSTKTRLDKIALPVQRLEMMRSQITYPPTGKNPVLCHLQPLQKGNMKLSTPSCLCLSATI
jgi:hypothetical protein